MEMLFLVHKYRIMICFRNKRKYLDEIQNGPKYEELRKCMTGNFKDHKNATKRDMKKLTNIYIKSLQKN